MDCLTPLHCLIPFLVVVDIGVFCFIIYHAV